MIYSSCTHDNNQGVLLVIIVIHLIYGRNHTPCVYQENLLIEHLPTTHLLCTVCVYLYSGCILPAVSHQEDCENIVIMTILDKYSPTP